MIEKKMIEEIINEVEKLPEVLKEGIRVRMGDQIYLINKDMPRSTFLLELLLREPDYNIYIRESKLRYKDKKELSSLISELEKLQLEPKHNIPNIPNHNIYNIRESKLQDKELQLQ